MLSATHLACSRGERLLFKDLSLALAPGAWLQVSGTNGAGKTTLLRTVVGLSEPEHGEVRWNGVPITECAETYRRALLYLGHHAAVKDELTPLENLRLANELDGLPLADADALSALQRMSLHGRGKLPTRWLSAGQKRRVLLARLLVRPATLWVLDEPFAALDTNAVALIGELLRAHLASGGMALLTSHQPVPLTTGGAEVAL
ncbi:MAG: cytochrome c biogenesis heme-transporting ATPase CcmA [Burkholderiales bacterium]